MSEDEFRSVFSKLTGNENGHFPWQWDLYRRFAAGDIPASCTLPTGLGKTSVVALWLIALATNRDKVPWRLVYVVNRRTVVDQTTNEVEKLRANLPVLNAWFPELALSTLRGQFADNREWSADPSRPAVICGTVDMIGSRLLFGGYGIGRSSRPLHAGFVGQDALLVHDEAHLEPAFQTLLERIRDEQDGRDFRPLKVMELTATSRGGGEVFGLTDRDFQHATVKERVGAKKTLHLHELKDAKKLAEQLVERAKAFEGQGRAVLVFARTVEDVMRVAEKLPRGRVLTLTGTMRGKERDDLIEHPIFKRFLPGGQSDGPTTYLVCTSAGEVGVNISADHLVCDLSTFDSVAQRFGRVNRFGCRDDTELHVVHPTEFEDKDYEQRRARTLALLRELKGDGSPAALGNLKAEARLAAFAPTPTILSVSDILFDAWALTTIRDKLPGRPPVEPYLHGVADDSHDTEFAWREEVGLLTGKVSDDAIAELLGEFPLKPHEALRVPTFGKKNGAYVHLEAIRARDPELPVWVIEPNGDVRAFPTLDDLLKTTGKDQYAVSLAGRTVVLPPKAGGLTGSGTLQGSEPHAEGVKYDVASTPPPKVAPLVRLLVTPGEGRTIKPVAPVEGWPADVEITRSGRTYHVLGQQRLRVVFALDFPDPDDEDAPPRQYVVVRRIEAADSKEVASEWPALDRHLSGVAGFAKEITARLKLDPKLASAVILAAKWHDHGKARPVWQRGAGNRSGYGPVAKTLHGRAPENLNHYRHELGSMVDVSTRTDLAAEFDHLDADQRDVVLHLIAAHHGRGRPHFPGNESYDVARPAAEVEGVVAETPARFARLQRRFGRWGLAYLESLLRAADILESRRIESAPLPEQAEWPKAEPAPSPTLCPFVPKPAPAPSITVAVDPTNPGQFFACCGLLELADRLWPGAEGWFANGQFQIACGGTLAALFEDVRRAGLAGELSPDLQKEREALEARKRQLKKAGQLLTTDEEKRRKALGTLLREGNIRVGKPFDLLLDWWQEDTDENPKTWAGSQEVLRIAAAALTACERAVSTGRFFEYSCVMRPTEGDGDSGKVEPFYFDGRRAANARDIDIGFSPNKLDKFETFATPAVEFFALVGLQRCRPMPTESRRVFDYFTWSVPCEPAVLPLAVCGLLGDQHARGYQFENAFRTGQKKQKAFNPATPLGGSR